jgi:hypothetical protein
LRLADGARLECDWSAGVFALRFAGDAIPVNRTAARILALCDGHHTRGDVYAALAALCSSRSQAQFIDAFMDAARKRRWIAEAAV